MRALPYTTVFICLLATPALAQGSIVHASNASAAASEAVGELTLAGVKTVGGAAALPLGIVGVASMGVGASATAGGSVLTEAGEGLAEVSGEALEAAWGPLDVDDAVVVRPDGPPTLKPKTDEAGQ